MGERTRSAAAVASQQVPTTLHKINFAVTILSARCSMLVIMMHDMTTLARLRQRQRHPTETAKPSIQQQLNGPMLMQMNDLDAKYGVSQQAASAMQVGRAASISVRSGRHLSLKAMLSGALNIEAQILHKLPDWL